MTPAPVLALRFVISMAILALVPYLLWDLLGSGAFGEGTGPRYLRVAWVEESILFSLLACAAVGVFACWQPVGCPFRPIHARRVLAAYLPVALAWVVFLVVYLALARAWGTPVPVQTGLEFLARGTPARFGFWVVVFTICVAAPLAEEIVFRGYLQAALHHVVPAWAAIVITAAAFGAVHGLPYALPIGLLGCLFGWLRARHGSLLPSMLAHAVHNSLIVLVTVLWPESLAMLYHS